MKKLLGLIGLIFFTFCFAAQDTYQFDSPEKKQRFIILTSELRCLVCQNQTIAESNAPLAADLRGQIYQKILAGQSDADILNYLTHRYGDFILYRPPFKLQTSALWLLPFLILIGGTSYLFYYLRRTGSKN